MTYTVGSLFSGIGGLDLAAHWAGFETAWFVEREPFCQQILHKHWPGVAVHSDVFECHDLPHVDVIVGGFPCQPFSVAGNRRGADDERYLLPEMLRIISEVKPYAVLFENVPGFPSLNDGAEFKYLLRTLAEMGFDAEWGHLRASDCGAPHQRERWFYVAYAVGGGNIRPINTLSQRQRHSPAIGRQPDNTSNQSRNKLVNAISAGRQERNATPVASRTGHATRRHYTVENAVNKRRRVRAAGEKSPQIRNTRNNHKQHGITGAVARSAKPVLGGNVNGLPGWLDFVGWPACPGEDQYAYEPSRVTTDKLPNRAARLKALGNAVVPQVAYLLFAAIYEWLTAQETMTEQAS